MKFILLILSVILFSQNCLAENDNPIKITSITIGQMTNDSAAEKSIILKLFNTGNTINRWQLGFYTPASFMQEGTYNPNLVMSICDDKNSCTTLTYQKSSAVTLPDLSAGYTTILKPANIFPLQPRIHYTVKLLHNSQLQTANYSFLPQSFFLIHSNNQVIHIDTRPSTYQILNYDQNAITEKINEHIATNWNSSISKKNSGNLIVPSPVSYLSATGKYQLKNGVIIHDLLSSNSQVTQLFVNDLQKDKMISASIDNRASKTGIVIQKIKNPALIQNNPEGYQIVINSGGVAISALNTTGVFYALQTLRQLWNKNINLSACTITDYPRFQYRGILLDTSRHFFTVTKIKNLIDIMTAHKLNALHIHFTDDEGFSLPFAFIGSRRGLNELIGPMLLQQENLDFTNTQHDVYPFADTIYSDHYSANDIQEIIRYANQNKITVIPEIDIPGHARSIVKSFPHSMVDPNDHSPSLSIQGYTDNVLPICTYNTHISVGDAFTRRINSMVNQIALLFDNQNTLYARPKEISVGADEVNAHAWSNDSSCQGDWANLTALEKSQKFLQMLASNNSSLLFSGWQQLVQTDGNALGNSVVPPNQTGHVYIWNTADNGIAQAASLAQAGYPVVLAFSDETYFDLAYTPDIHEPGFTWAAPFSDTDAALSSALSATHVINQISNPAQQKNILGIEGALWSENLPSYHHLIYMAIPKMAGLSEASWSPQSKTVAENRVDWQSLAQRLGCGDHGFLAYLHQVFDAHYRGYPAGIGLEVPEGACGSDD